MISIRRQMDLLVAHVMILVAAVAIAAAAVIAATVILWITKPQ